MGESLNGNGGMQIHPINKYITRLKASRVHTQVKQL